MTKKKSTSEPEVKTLPHTGEEPEIKKLPHTGPIPKPQNLAQKPKKFKLELDEAKTKELHDFVHNNFVGLVADPIIEKFGLKNKTVSLSSEQLLNAMLWLDMENKGKVRVPIHQVISKLLTEETAPE